MGVSVSLSERVFPVASLPAVIVSGEGPADFLWVHTTAAGDPVTSEARGGEDFGKTSSDPGTVGGRLTVLGGGGPGQLLVFDRPLTRGRVDDITVGLPFGAPL